MSGISAKTWVGNVGASGVPVAFLKTSEQHLWFRSVCAGLSVIPSKRNKISLAVDLSSLSPPHLQGPSRSKARADFVSFPAKGFSMREDGVYSLAKTVVLCACV